MDSFSCVDLVRILRTHCPDVDELSFDAILQGKVSGKRASKYTSVEWTNLGIPYGDAVDIMGAINEFLQGNKQNFGAHQLSFMPPAERSAPECSNSSMSVVPTQTQCSTRSKISPSDKSDLDNSPGHDKDSYSKYDCLKQFFTPQAFEEMSSYDKDNYLAIQKNYDHCRSEGIHMVLPKFMQPKPVPKARRTVLSVPSTPTRKSSRNLKNMQKKTQEEHQSNKSAAVSNTSRDFNELASTSTSTASPNVSTVEVVQNLSISTATDILNNIPTSTAFNNLEVFPPTSTASEILNNGPTSAASNNLEVFPPTSTASEILNNGPTSAASNNLEVFPPTSTASEILNNGPTSAASNNFEVFPSTSTASNDLNVVSNTRSAFNDIEVVLSRQRKRKKRVSDLLTDEEFSMKLPKYDIKALLSKAGDQLKPVRRSLDKSGIVVGAERKLMMRTLTKHLFYDENGKVKHVSTDMKSGMAASIVEAFPLFKDHTPNKRPWWRVFDPTGPSGFISNCATSIFRKMKPEERPRGGGAEHREVSSDEDSGPPASTSSGATFHDPDASWMSLTMPFTAQKGGLLKGMEKSFPIRREWINTKSPSITEILQRYPHLMSFGSEMLEKEFDSMYPDKSLSFLKVFPDLINSFKEGNELDLVEGLQSGEANDVIGICLTLAKQLPRPNLQRYNRMAKSLRVESVMPEMKTLLHTIPLGVNPKDVVRQKRQDALHPIQPYLMALVPDKQVVKLFLVADSEIIEANTSSLLQGLDLLFKAYSVFNVDYPLGWKCFWEMIEHGVFKIEPQKLTNSARELLIKYKIINVAVQN